MAMIDAYRIGVDLVLGGDLAAGIAALIPGLERLDSGITHANAEAAALAAGLRGVVETAPGIGRAADEMDRLSAAMTGVNRAVEAWRSGGGTAEPSGPPQARDDLATGPHHQAPLDDVVEVPDDASGLTRGSGAGVRPKPSPEPRGPLDAVMPALLPGEPVESGVGAGADAGAHEAADPALQPGAVERSVRARTPAREATTGVLAAYELAAYALPVYVQDAWEPGGSERASSGRDGTASSSEPLRDDVLPDVFGAVDPASDAGRPGGKSVGAVEGVLSALPGRSVGVNEMVMEPLPRAQAPLQVMSDVLRPGIAMPDIHEPIRDRVVGLDAAPAAPALLLERPKDVDHTSRARATDRRRGLSQAVAVPASEPARAPAVADLTRIGPWSRPNPEVAKPAAERLPFGILGPGASRIKDALAGLTASEAQGGLFVLADGIAAVTGAMDKMPQGWLGATENTAGPLGGPGSVPSLAASSREQSDGVNLPRQFHGYHPQGMQPGPVIEHITYLHLDDREIARAVTRQQLRMMGGQVSGTLRPDPSLAPQYGAHLLET